MRKIEKALWFIPIIGLFIMAISAAIDGLTGREKMVNVILVGIFGTYHLALTVPVCLIIDVLRGNI